MKSWQIQENWQNPNFFEKSMIMGDNNLILKKSMKIGKNYEISRIS